MNESGGSGITEVEPGQVNEVGNEDDLRGPEMAADEAHNETEPEQVVEDEVGAHVARMSAPAFVA